MTHRQLNTYMLVQALLWATLLIVTGIVLHDTGYNARMIELLLPAAVVSVFVIPYLMRRKTLAPSAGPVPRRRRRS